MSAAKPRTRYTRKTKDPKLSKAVYCLAPMHDNIVDAVLKIMDDDGPTPMRNMRPAQKYRTGAERFEIEHHGEYEARVQQSQNRITRVATHNAAYPKMYDELDKRRSTAKTTVVTNYKQFSGYAVGKQLKNKSQRNTSRRSKSQKNKKTYKGTTGITKRKQKLRHRNSRLQTARLNVSKFRTHKGCQCTYQRKLLEKSVSTSNDYESVPAMKIAVNQFDRSLDKPVKQEFEPVSRPKSLSIIIKSEPKSESQIQETSIPSITSYNSYLSMDHEPMVE